MLSELRNLNSRFYKEKWEIEDYGLLRYSYPNAGRLGDSEAHRGARHCAVDHNRHPNAPIVAPCADIQANSIKVEQLIAQVVQPTLPLHHTSTLDHSGGSYPVFAAFQSWKSMERHRQGTLRTHRQFSQEPFLLHRQESTSQTRQAFRLQG